MKTNVGSIDRILRIVLGLGLLSLLLFLSGPVRYVGLLGIVFLATAFMRFCPLYFPFGVSTNASTPVKK